MEMRPSLFASSVSHEPLWPAGVVGVFSPAAATPASGSSATTAAASSLVFMKISLVGVRDLRHSTSWLQYPCQRQDPSAIQALAPAGLFRAPRELLVCSD